MALAVSLAARGNVELQRDGRLQRRKVATAERQPTASVDAAARCGHMETGKMADATCVMRIP